MTRSATPAAYFLPQIKKAVMVLRQPTLGKAGLLTKWKNWVHIFLSDVALICTYAHIYKADILAFTLGGTSRSAPTENLIEKTSADRAVNATRN